MFRRLRSVGIVVLALGLVLGGVAPVWAAPLVQSMTSADMAGMADDASMGPGTCIDETKQDVDQKMPCKSMQGACGTCVTGNMLGQPVLGITFLGVPSPRISASNPIRSSISVPPALPPPIV